MQEIISNLLEKFSTWSEYENEITKTLDRYLHSEHKKSVRGGYGSNYMIFGDVKNEASFRFPGATRGHIVWDEDCMINEIKIYDDMQPIYKKSVMKELDKFIGAKIIIPEN
jgi:hypothetical protein